MVDWESEIRSYISFSRRLPEMTNSYMKDPYAMTGQGFSEDVGFPQFAQ